tara:strand:+ start:389 stop:676 length:288 start_codon:yes stop_codon:yes gene_type:complete
VSEYHRRSYGPDNGFDHFVTKVQTDWVQIKSEGLDGTRMSGKGLRYGQVFFNTLSEEHPNLAERIRSTPRDPFHWDEVKQEIWEYCSEMWDTTSF